jgi:serine/threonine protein kinase
VKEVSCPRRRTPFPLVVAVDIMLQIARGMEYLHAKGIYHGELNPSNVLVKPRQSDGGYVQVKVAPIMFKPRQDGDGDWGEEGAGDGDGCRDKLGLKKMHLATRL